MIPSRRFLFAFRSSSPGLPRISTTPRTSAPQAQIRLRGPARVLRDLAPESVHAVIDLHGATPGEHTYDLTTDQIRVPHDVEVMQVTPSRLRLVFDTARDSPGRRQAARRRHAAARISHRIRDQRPGDALPSPARRAM